MICAAFIAVYSLHFSGDFNNRTPGVGVTCEIQGVEYGSLIYRNSINRNSVAASIGYRFKVTDSVSLSPFVGLGTGYYARVSPIAGVSFKYDKYQVIFLPPSPKSSAALNFSMFF